MTEKPEDSLDDIFETLKIEGNRHVLNYLQESDGHAHKDEIADYIQQQTGQSGRAAYVATTHKHLPWLEDRSWIHHDERTGAVSLDLLEEDSKDNLLVEYLDQTSNEAEGALDNVFNMLSNERRRKTLYWLENEQDRKSTLNGTATYLAREGLRDPDIPQIGELEPTEQEVERAKVNLYQMHLPMLEDNGWVHYDDNTQMLTLDEKKAEEPDSLLLDYLEQAYEQEE